MSWDLDIDDIKSGKFHCPKWSFYTIYVEKNSICDRDRKPNVGFRNIFIKWIYNYYYDYHYKFNNNNIIEDYYSGGIQSWLIWYKNVREEEGYDEYIKKRENGYKEFGEDNRKIGKYMFSGCFIESETEERFVCFKCSYKGNIWAFIDEDKKNAIKSRRNIIKMESDKNKLENEKKKLEDEIRELKSKKEEEKNKKDNSKKVDEKKNNIKLTFENKDKNISFPIECNEGDKFKELEDKFIENFPEYSDFDITFNNEGKSIKRHKTLKDNGIKNNDVIYVNIEEDKN